ncbi:hypothetical protein F5877DRAFT_86644 [Lentinula edodes]|nr:hypothetical protein F5877DRAFT_86644 [Lentinula edodes]
MVLKIRSGRRTSYRTRPRSVKSGERNEEEVLEAIRSRKKLLSDLELAMAGGLRITSESGLSRNTSGSEKSMPPSSKDKDSSISFGLSEIAAYKGFDPDSITRHSHCLFCAPNDDDTSFRREVDLSHACDGSRTEKALKMSRCTFLMDAGPAEMYYICNLNTIYTKFFLRNRLKYALTGRELIPIVMQRVIKIDGKVRTYPAGFMGASSSPLRQLVDLL